MKKILIFIFYMLFTSFAFASNVDIFVDKSKQKMYVYIDDSFAYSWLVSTARKGYNTPVGTFSPTFLDRMHYSSKYENAPMPWSVFFNGGYAIHGTEHNSSLGSPASHGCIRLATKNAKILFDLVKSSDRTRIFVYKNNDGKF